MAVDDEPDFGFLNDDGSAPDPEPTEQFSFSDPATNPKPATPDEHSRPEASAPQTSAAQQTEEGPSKRRKVKRRAPEAAAVPAKRAARPKPQKQSTDAPEPSVTNPDKIAADGSVSNNGSLTKTVPKSQFLALAVFAMISSLLLLLQLLGVINLGGNHQLESVPDVAPLRDGEFQAIPETAALPPGHELKLGQAAQYGDIVFTPTKVVREPLSFVHMTTGKVGDNMQSRDVLKLYFTIKNVSDQLAFPPWDVALMNHRSPEEGLDESTKANSWLRVTKGNKSKRVLNFSHSPKSNFDIVGLQSRITLQPDESRSTFIASSEGIDDWLNRSADLRWRIQLRKGVNEQSQQSVTTLVDVTFAEGDIQL